MDHELKARFIEKLKRNSPGQYTIHNCGMCDYPCGFLYKTRTCPTCKEIAPLLYYDSGCDCVRGGPHMQIIPDSALDYLFNENSTHLEEIKAFVNEH